ncbi:MAG: hypothetical protein AMXMBFR33_38450 [Candidatus Xenobia bacterium]
MAGVETVEDYLDSVPSERRATLLRVRELVRESLDPGFEEGLQYGMIGWFVPLERYPKTYNGQPLTVVNLGSQKNHMALYLMCLYSAPEQRQRFEAAYLKVGKKLDMGKACLRFKKLEDLALEAISGELKQVTVDGFLAAYEASRRR